MSKHGIQANILFFLNQIAIYFYVNCYYVVEESETYHGFEYLKHLLTPACRQTPEGRHSLS